MTVQWTVRATNDRRAQFARDQVLSFRPKTLSYAERFFIGLEVGVVVNDSPVDCQSHE